MQPGGHRFEPGILHQFRRAELALYAQHGKMRGSLTTEYPANGSSFLRTHAVFRRDRTHVVSGFGWGVREFETLVVKLLRAYGECLGARSR